MTDEREPLTDADLADYERAAREALQGGLPWIYVKKLTAEVRRLRAENTLQGIELKYTRQPEGIHFYLTDELLSDEAARREFIRGEVESHERNS